MRKFEDVYEYRDKLLVPKLVISATGDEFFVLDNTRFFIYLHVLVVNAEDIKSKIWFFQGGGGKICQ